MSSRLSFKKRVISRIKLQMAQPRSLGRVLGALKQNTSGPRYLLLGTPIHGNLGDHLLTLSAVEYISENFGEVIEVPMECFMLYGERIARQLREDDMVFICGGGWMGTIWKEDELRLQKMLRLFSGQKVVVLPQTAFYDPNSPDYRELLSSMQGAIEGANWLCFTFRDQKSYDFAQKEFPKEKTYLLLPDNALIFTPEQLPAGQREGIYLCLREDCEARIDAKKKEAFSSMLKAEGYAVRKGSTIDWKIVPTSLRRKRVYKKLSEIGSCRLMITDRLHGMIFAVLSSTPCIVLDNASKKVSGVWRLWLKDCPLVMLAEDLSQVSPEMIRQMMQVGTDGKTEQIQKTQKAYYQKLTEEIRKWEKQSNA